MYPSDLTDNEWRLLKELIDKHGPQPERGGRPRIYELRTIVNAILYVNKTGCQWRQLPKEFPPWDTVYGYFRRWRHSGLWQRLWAELHERVRVHAGREPTPSVAVIDAQSVKTSGKGGKEALMPAKKPKAESATSPSTPKAGCWR